MTIRLKWMEATSYRPFTEHLERGIEEHIAGVANIRPTGIAYTMLTTVSSLISNVLRSFGVAVFVITLFMIVLLRELLLEPHRHGPEPAPHRAGRWLHGLC